MVICWLCVASTAPAALRSVIVTVATPALSARNCQVTFCRPAAATVGTGCDATCGELSRIDVDGVKLIATVMPLAAVAPPLLTAAVAGNVWPRTTVAGIPVSASVATGGAPLLTVTETAADVVELFAASN